MHPADGQSRQRTADWESDPADLVARPDGHEGGQENYDRNEEGESCEALVVRDLNREMPIAEDDCAVADVVHAPDGNASHGDRRAEEERPGRDPLVFGESCNFHDQNTPVVEAFPSSPPVKEL